MKAFWIYFGFFTENVIIEGKRKHIYVFIFAYFVPLPHFLHVGLSSCRSFMDSLSVFLNISYILKLHHYIFLVQLCGSLFPGSQAHNSKYIYVSITHENYPRPIIPRARVHKRFTFMEQSRILKKIFF